MEFLHFLLDPCDNFRCKRGKTCKLDADSKPGCVCQDPLECPSSMNTFEHVSMCKILLIQLESLIIKGLYVCSGLWDR